MENNTTSSILVSRTIQMRRMLKYIEVWKGITMYYKPVVRRAWRAAIVVIR
jgi:hypothetical protein